MFLMVLWLTEQQTVKYKIKFEVGTSAKFDLGLDLKLFNNKVSIVTDYFTDTRKFIDSKHSCFRNYWKLCSGASAPTVNAGTVKIQGLNFLLITKIPFQTIFL
jgi:outer membrane receptor protein involved in Fe transport